MARKGQVVVGEGKVSNSAQGVGVDQNLPFILFATQNGAGGGAIIFDWTLKFSFFYWNVIYGTHKVAVQLNRNFEYANVDGYIKSVYTENLRTRKTTKYFRN